MEKKELKKSTSESNIQPLAEESESLHDSAEESESLHDSAEESESLHDSAEESESLHNSAEESESLHDSAEESESLHDSAEESESLHDLAEESESLHDLAEESESLRDLVDAIIKYSQQRTKIMDEYFKKKTKKSKNVFRFPFILKQEHIVSLSNCIQRRLKESNGNNYELRFFAQAEFSNHDTLSFQNQEDFFEATHNEKMLRITMNWEYSLNIDMEGLIVPHNFDIIIKYEVEQDSDEKENYKLEEWGIIYVEGLENDWINGTLNELKTIVFSTKMPFWFRWPKLALLYLRDFTKSITFVLVSVLVFFFLSPLFMPNNNTQVFLEQLRSVTDVAEKLQQYIEYMLTANNISGTIILYYLLGMIMVVILYILINKLSRYLFPPSMILIGSAKEKQKNILTTYTFVWGTITTVTIGTIVTAIAQFVIN